MSPISSDLERFGTPQENILAAERRQPIGRRKIPYHTRVPTRRDVGSLPVAELAPLLIGWMEHSPTEIIPSQAQIHLVMQVLLERSDVGDVMPLLQMCRNYVAGD